MPKTTLYGVYPATVVDDRDPEALGRVQVSLARTSLAPSPRGRGSQLSWPETAVGRGSCRTQATRSSSPSRRATRDGRTWSARSGMPRPSRQRRWTPRATTRAAVIRTRWRAHRDRRRRVEHRDRRRERQRDTSRVSGHHGACIGEGARPRLDGRGVHEHAPGGRRNVEVLGRRPVRHVGDQQRGRLELHAGRGEYLVSFIGEEDPSGTKRWRR